MVRLLPRRLVSFILSLCPVLDVIESGLGPLGATKTHNVPPGIFVFDQTMD